MRDSDGRLAGRQLAGVLCRNWVVLLLRGLIAVVLGVLALLLTKYWISVLVLPFGLYALADGILGVGMTFGEYAGRGHLRVLALWGLVSLGVGILTLLVPPHTRLHFAGYFALWAVATGVVEVVTAFLLQGGLGVEWVFLLAGLASVATGVLFGVLVYLDKGAFILSRLIAAYTFGFGIALGILGLRARTAPLPRA